MARLVAPEAPEELEGRRDRSAGRRRRPGGPETCQGMLLVMPRQALGALGTSSSIFSKIELRRRFLKRFEHSRLYRESDLGNPVRFHRIQLVFQGSLYFKELKAPFFLLTFVAGISPSITRFE